jgi:hypothetical protein
VRAVCKNRLSRRESHSVLGPEDLVADSVGNKQGLRRAQARDASFFQIEIRIVARDGSIVRNRASQLAFVLCPCWNHRIRIKRPSFFG